MAAKIFISGVVSCLLLCATAAGATWYVPDDFATIQDAINASADGDTVIVRPGTYVENIDFMGKAITVMSWKGPDLTAIDGSKGGSVVTFNSGEGPDSTLTGFCITNGSSAMGGGIYCKAASPTITGNIITANEVSMSGGGVYCDNDNATISHNTISDNRSDERGGGIECKANSTATIVSNTITRNFAEYCGGGLTCDFTSTMVIRGNTFSENATDGFGGAILCDLSDPLIDSNIFCDNFAIHSGGAIYGHESDISLINNVITENSTLFFAGGVLLDGLSSSTLTCNTITSNRADAVWGGGLCFWDEASATIKNTIFWGNEAPQGSQIAVAVNTGLPSSMTIDFCDVQGGETDLYVHPGCLYNWGANMIDSDPLFGDPDSRDYHLTFTSPCRGAGDPFLGLPFTDFEGDPRVVQGATSMGADEFYYHLYHTGEAFPGGSVDMKVVGLPWTPAFIIMGSGLLDPPWTTPYGLFHLKWPFQFNLIGTISQSGILAYTGTIPISWAPGSEVPFQALTSGKLTNLMVLTIE